MQLIENKFNTVQTWLCLISPGLPLVRCYSHGQSNPTYYICYGGREMVLRKKPVSGQCLNQWVYHVDDVGVQRYTHCLHMITNKLCCVIRNQKEQDIFTGTF